MAMTVLLAILALGGVGVEQNPKAPSAAEVLRYAPGEADYMVHFDAAAVLPGTYKAIRDLPNEPVVAAVPELLEAAQTVVREMDMALGQVRQMIGFQPITDIGSVTAWFSLEGAPQVLVVVRGDLPRDLVQRLAGLTGSEPVPLGTSQVLEVDGMVLGMSHRGDALFGSREMVAPRLAADWRPVRPARDTLGARANKLLRGKPFLALASAPRGAARQLIEGQFAHEQELALLADILLGHSYAELAMTHKGVSWTWIATESAGYDRAKLASEGMIDLMRAGHHLARGSVRLLLAGMASYADQSEVIALLLQHQEAVLDLALQHTGDGNFTARVQGRERDRTVTVTASARRLSEVIPIGALVPLAGAGAAFWMLDAKAPETRSEDIEAVPAEPLPLPAPAPIPND